VGDDFAVVTGIKNKHVICCKNLVKTIFTPPTTIPKLVLNMEALSLSNYKQKPNF
jgi:hypothetical protein